MAEDKEPIRVLLIDDHKLTREGTRSVLEEASDIKVVGEGKDGYEAKALTAELRPDILLLDLQMPGPSPAEIEAWVRHNYPKTVTLVLTAHDRDTYLAGMAKAGAVGYIIKEEAAERLIEAIRRAVRGEILFTESQRKRMAKWELEARERWAKLSSREREVLRLVAEGLMNHEISEQLEISEKTVANHVSRILQKLKASNRTEAAIWAVRKGFIPEHQDLNVEALDNEA
jgi:DNA-binding NarL/FixJ family response regulator